LFNAWRSGQYLAHRPSSWLAELCAQYLASFGCERAAAPLALPRDVRYDLEWFGRLQRLVRTVEAAGFAIVAILGLAAALTVASVVRLAAASRSDEIEIMRLVGAPLSTIRAPFVVEGLLQGAIGAGLALGLLAAGAWLVRLRYGSWLSEVTGLDRVAFLPPLAIAGVIGAGVVLGGLGGFFASRRAARP